MQKIVRSDDLRRQNRRSVLAALRRLGATSRTALSAATGLSNSTVTLITGSLLEAGALVQTEAGEVNARRGRPQVALALNPRTASVGVLTVTLNRLSATVIDYAGNRRPERVLRLDTKATGETALRQACVALMREALADEDPATGPLRQITIAVQGIADADGGQLLWSPVTALTQVPIGQWMSEAFGVPSTVANDCAMIAAALHWREPQRYSDNFAAILLSHGIGMGLYLNGLQFTGIHSSAAEFGHMCLDPRGAACRCGRRGCIEAYAGDYAIWRNAKGVAVADAFADIERSQMERLAQSAKAGPGPEREAYRVAGEALGAGLRSLFALFDPFPVAFVGSGVLAFELIEPALRETIGLDTTGVTTQLPPISCFLDEFSLIGDGALITALTHIDNTIAGATDAPQGSTAHAT